MACYVTTWYALACGPRRWRAHHAISSVLVLVLVLVLVCRVVLCGRGAGAGAGAGVRVRRPGAGRRAWGGPVVPAPAPGVAGGAGRAARGSGRPWRVAERRS
ncbi:hypothetical protein OYE22_27270 [Streptomyces sp. 71268]|uniref:hypothetical protein n=1 Tax=Streptomyces sp. 71268 TaxID=3002640 RepID=UPI0023FA48C8|nr:hypothetical protein [Streptomyces sp. 71268]WEV28474.1 hypothetical protein OYE22_27270 [Streptomyces sp. 71268]